MEHDIRRLVEQLDAAWPYKRITVPDHLREKFNEEQDLTLTDVAFTVSKEFEVADESLWKLMKETRGLSMG